MDVLLQSSLAKISGDRLPFGKNSSHIDSIGGWFELPRV